MKIARMHNGAMGIVLEIGGKTKVVDVVHSIAALQLVDPDAAEVIRNYLGENASGPWTKLIDYWPTTGPALKSLSSSVTALDGAGFVTQDVVTARLRPPLCAPDVAVFAAGANFAQHAAQASARGSASIPEIKARMEALVLAKRSGAPPWGFNILPRTIIGPDDTTALPNGSHKLDYEGEVAITLRVDDNGIYPWAVSAWNDVSIRGQKFGLGPRIDEGPLTWSLQKNFDGGSACGPWLVVSPEVNIDDLDVRTCVNGKVRQKGNTSEMVYSFEELISHVSNSVTLRSGDVIVSGTPSGTAVEEGIDGPFLEAGDVVEVEVKEIGTLRNYVGPAGSATLDWDRKSKPISPSSQKATRIHNNVDAE
jgi:2-keto-4-pentenoate hydratase/2-oxohepta-3-ene-1,7-dioic acid hydratase in catechol pathway